MGIDYGMGQTNVDKETGVRYGVIHQNKLSSFALDDLYQQGDDVDFLEYRQSVADSIKSALEGVLEEHGLDRSNDVDDIVDVDSIVDEIDFCGYEGTGDCQRVSYEADGYVIESDSQGDLFVIKSPFYTRCDFCSPCAPGAGYLTSDGFIKTYCLGHDWFDEETPYRVFRMDNDEEVFRKE